MHGDDLTTLEFASFACPAPRKDAVYDRVETGIGYGENKKPFLDLLVQMLGRFWITQVPE